MEHCSLHPIDLDVVNSYVAALNGDSSIHFSSWASREIEPARSGYARAKLGDEDGAIAVGFGLATLLSETQPSFFQEGISLTTWEARIDRGIGMMIRPPSRLFVEAGLDPVAARAMPIRLDVSRGMMCGAYIPAHLIDQVEEQLYARFHRLVRRMVEAELDVVPTMALIIDAIRYAKQSGLGLLEAIDAASPEAPELRAPTAQVLVVDVRRMDPYLKKRIQEAAKPPKKPGRFSWFR
jgi:hypothetical protein